MSSSSKVSFQKTNDSCLYPGNMVKIKQMRHLVEVKHVSKICRNFDNIRKISKTEYVVLDTGEIHEYSLSSDRSQNVSSFKRTTRRIRDLINNNFIGSQNELFITLTYKDNVTDPKQFYGDFKRFWQRFKYRYGNDVDYLNIVEPQERGAWHGHVLIRFNDRDSVYIPNSEIAALWGCGFTKTKRLEQVDNIGAYLSAYLADIELTDDNFLDVVCKGSEIVEKDVEGQKKRFVKGGRVHLYPSGMNIVRSSKGIKYPDELEMSYGETKKITGNSTPDYSTTVTVLDDANRVLNTITYEHYNLKRKK